MSDDLIKGSEFTSAKSYAPEVKARAYELFLTTDLSLMDIAIDLGISDRVVATWSRMGKWRNRKKEIEMELFNSAEDEYRALIIKHRKPVIERHLKVTEKIENSIGDAVDELTKDGEAPSLMELKRAAEAMSAAANVSARAAAISERPFSDPDGDGGGNRKAPLITLNVQAAVPPGGSQDPKPIDINVD